MDKFAANLTDVLQERVPDLATAGSPEDVETIVQEVEDEARRRTPIPNTLVYQITVATLGLSVLLVIGAQWALAVTPADIPEGLIAIGSAAIGALAGLLAPTSQR